ncbi:MAG: regulatory protein RecX [Lentisphaeria bacterium]|nr:recombination regulator RecX [Lentisphaeria bacterium]NQZ70798.1 regulatory protein RecX [Lentisphaeria bacterium]
MEIEIVKSTLKGKKYLIKISTGETIKLSQETVFRYGIFESQIFDEDLWLEILYDALEQDCYNKITRLIANRMHAEGELRQKLYKANFGKEVIARALQRAAENQLINDAFFARIFVEEKLNTAQQGRQKVRAALFQRGVKKEIIDEAFANYEAEFGSDAVLESLKVLAEKKWRSLKDRDELPKRKQKLLAYLASRGFEAKLCYMALDFCTGDQDSDNFDFY